MADTSALDGLDFQALLRDDGFTLDNDLDTLFVMWATTLVLFMQVGFLLLEFGHVQPKNSRTVIMKNTLDNAFGILAWFLLGSTLSGGPYGTGNRWIGTDWAQTVEQWHGVASTPPGAEGSISSHPDALWSFYFAFASSAATIVSGAIAERAQMRAHLVLSVCMCGLIYPIAAYWVWGQNGFLSGLSGSSSLFGVGVIDVAGGGVVHVLGGTAALVSAFILGPRTGCPPHPEAQSPRNSDGSPRFSKGVPTGGTVRIRAEQDKDIIVFNAARPAARAMIALGAFIMWFTWYGFNIGSLGGISGRSGVAAHAMLITTLSAMSGAVTSVVCAKFTSCFSFTISTTCNGMVAGLVASAACCAIVPTWAGIIAGVVAATFAQTLATIAPMVGIDDPVNAGPTHLAGGVTGMLCVALFSERSLLESYLFRNEVKTAPDIGLVFGGSGKLLASQLVGILVIIAWSALVTGALMFSLKLMGMLRQSLEVEVLGMDAQMFEVKQRDEKLAFKVIQHVRAAQVKEEDRKKGQWACFRDPHDAVFDDDGVHPFPAVALNRRITALSHQVAPDRLSLSTASTASVATHSTAGLRAHSAHSISAQSVGPHSVYGTRSPPSTPTSPRGNSGGSTGNTITPLEPGAGSAVSATGLSFAMATAVAKTASAVAGAAVGGLVTGASAPLPHLGHAPQGPSPLGIGAPTTNHSAFPVVSAAAPAAAMGGMFAAHRSMSASTHRSMSGYSSTVPSAKAYTSSSRTSSDAGHSGTHTRAPTIGASLAAKVQQSNAAAAAAGQGPLASTSTPLWPQYSSPPIAPPGPSYSAPVRNSSARLLSNVEAVAASARSSTSCFKNILEASTHSTASSSNFSGSSHPSTRQTHSAAHRDQSELTFAENLSHSSQSVSPKADGGTLSPQSPGPNSMPGVPPHPQQATRMHTSSSAAATFPGAAQEAATPTPESISLCLPPEPPSAVDSAGARIVASGVAGLQTGGTGGDVFSSAQQTDVLLQSVQFQEPQEHHSHVFRTSEIMHEAHALEHGEEYVDGEVRGGTEAAELMSQQMMTKQRGTEPGQISVGEETSFKGGLPDSPVDEAGPMPTPMVPTSGSSGVPSSIDERSPSAQSLSHRRASVGGAYGRAYGRLDSGKSSVSRGSRGREIRRFDSGKSSVSMSSCGSSSMFPHSRDSGTGSVERVAIRRTHTMPASGGTNSASSSSLELTGGRAVRVGFVQPHHMRPLLASKVHLAPGIFTQEGEEAGEARTVRGGILWTGLRAASSASGEDSTGQGGDSASTARSDALTLKGFAVAALPPPPGGAAAEAAAAASAEGAEAPGGYRGTENLGGYRAAGTLGGAAAIGSDHSVALSGSAGSRAGSIAHAAALSAHPPNSQAALPDAPVATASQRASPRTTPPDPRSNPCSLDASAQPSSSSGATHRAASQQHHSSGSLNFPPPTVSVNPAISPDPLSRQLPDSYVALSAIGGKVKKVPRRARTLPSHQGSMLTGQAIDALPPPQRRSLPHVSSKYPTELPSTNSGSLEAAAAALEEDEEEVGGARAVREANAMRNQLPQPRRDLVPMPASGRSPSPSPRVGGSSAGFFGSTRDARHGEGKVGEDRTGDMATGVSVESAIDGTEGQTQRVRNSDSQPDTDSASSLPHGTGAQLTVESDPPEATGPQPGAGGPLSPLRPAAAASTVTLSPPQHTTSTHGPTLDSPAVQTPSMPPPDPGSISRLGAASAAHSTATGTLTPQSRASVAYTSAPSRMMHSVSDSDTCMHAEASEADSLFDPQPTTLPAYDPISDFPSEVLMSPMMTTMTSSSTPPPQPPPHSRQSEESGRFDQNAQRPVPLSPLSPDAAAPERAKAVTISRRHVFRPAGRGGAEAPASANAASTPTPGGAAAPGASASESQPTAATRGNDDPGGNREISPLKPPLLVQQPAADNRAAVDSPDSFRHAEDSTGGLVALNTLPQAIAGELGPIWADSGHSSQLAGPLPRAGAHSPSRGGNHNSSVSVATSDVSGSLSGSVSLSLTGIGRGGLPAGRRLSRGGRGQSPGRGGHGGSAMGGAALASAAGESTEIMASQSPMGSETSLGMERRTYVRNVSVGSTVSNVSAPSPVEGGQHWEDIAEMTSESETRACDSDGTPPHGEPRASHTLGFTSPPSPPNSSHRGNTAAMPRSNDGTPVAIVSEGPHAAQRDPRNVFRKSPDAMHDSPTAPQYAAAVVHSTGGSSHSSAAGAGVGVATSADIAARSVPLLHAPAASPKHTESTNMHGTAPLHYAAASGGRSSSENSLTLME